MGQGKRGKALETMIIHTNRIYKMKGWALVDKVPTPWVVHYNKKTGRVYKAFPEEKSTVDFIGVSHGRHMAFDAKSTKETTRFDLSNIQQHQMDYLKRNQEQGGISFFIIEFAKRNERFFVPFDFVQVYWDAMMCGGRKSIPYKDIWLGCDPVKAEKGVALHYLDHIPRKGNQQDERLLGSS